jgi:hypothetical protein
MIGEGDCGAIGGMKIGKGNRSTRRKPALAPLCPPQIAQFLRVLPEKPKGKHAYFPVKLVTANGLHYVCTC